MNAACYFIVRISEFDNEQEIIILVYFLTTNICLLLPCPCSQFRCLVQYSVHKRITVSSLFFVKLQLMLRGTLKK